MDWSKNKYEVRDYFFQLKTDCLSTHLISVHVCAPESRHWFIFNFKVIKIHSKANNEWQWLYRNGFKASRKTLTVWKSKNFTPVRFVKWKRLPGKRQLYNGLSLDGLHGVSSITLVLPLPFHSCFQTIIIVIDFKPEGRKCRKHWNMKKCSTGRHALTYLVTWNCYQRKVI